MNSQYFWSIDVLPATCACSLYTLNLNETINYVANGRKKGKTSPCTIRTKTTGQLISSEVP